MSGHSYPPPTGAPVAASTAAPSAAPAPGAAGGPGPRGVDTASSSPPVAGRRFALPTASVLRALRLLTVLACLLAGAAGAYVLNLTISSLDTIDAGTQQVLRLEQVKGDVLRADGLATAGLAQGTSASALTDYTDALSEASRLVVEASRAQPLDQADLTSVNGGLLTYALTMERARTAYPQNNAGGLKVVAEAGAVLSSGTVPALDKLIAANQARVDAARASDRIWAVGLALVPVLLLLGASVWVARRTRRVLNIGLVLALTASVLLWRLVDTNLASAAGVVDAARSGSLQTASAAATAYSSLAEAKSIEGRELLQPATTASLDASWAAAANAATAAAGKLDGYAAGQVQGRLAAYTSAHVTLADLLKANRVTEGRAAAASTTTGVTPTYRAASDALSAAFSDATEQTRRDVAAQRDALAFGTVLAVLLGLFGAVAAWVGLARRLREYR